MSALARALRTLIAAAGICGVLAYAAAAGLTVADIVGRQANLPIPGVVDLVQLFVLAGAWLAIPYAFLTGAHVGVDLLVDTFPARLRAPLQVLARLAAIALLALMLRECHATLQQKMMFGDRSQQLGIPIVYYWVPLLVGVALSIMAAALTLLPARSAVAAGEETPQ